MSDASDDSYNDNQIRRQRLRKIYVEDDYESNLEVGDDGNGELGLAGALVQSSKDLVWVLEELCNSDTLSVKLLQRIINQDIIDTEDMKESSFFHRACYNKNITRDILNCLLDFYPDASQIAKIIYPDQKTKAYPLHLACLNNNCSSAIILDLVKRNPTAISHMCSIHQVIQISHTPLHCYLSRPSNVDLDIVKLLRLGHGSARTDEEAAFAPIHVLCHNPGVNDMVDVLRFLIDSDPESVQFPGGVRIPGGSSMVPFLMACENTNATVTLANLLLEYWPEAIHKKDSLGHNPLHILSLNKQLDEVASEELFHFLLEKKFELLRERDLDDYLPIHCAAWNKAPEFCQLLLNAYPESIMIRGHGSLPIHEACAEGERVDTVRFLFEQYPACMSMRDEYECLPIHRAAENQDEQAAEIIKYLLLQDPDASSKFGDGRFLPLHKACDGYRVNLGSVRVLFDDYPEAIYKVDNDGRLPIDMAERRRDIETRDIEAVGIVAFLTEQLALVNKAKMETSNQLPLHNALCDESISLGAIKLIVKDFPASIHTSNLEGLLPLHIACARASVDIVKYLVELDASHLSVCDIEGKFPLHLSCDTSNHDVIKYLLEKNVSSISERTTTGMLPFHLLCLSAEIKEDVTNESLECTESLWRVLTAYPDAILSA